MCCIDNIQAFMKYFFIYLGYDHYDVIVLDRYHYIICKSLYSVTCPRNDLLCVKCQVSIQTPFCLCTISSNLLMI